MVAIIIIALVCAVIAEIATASRQIWSFARDGGLPFSPFLSKVRMLRSTFPSLFNLFLFSPSPPSRHPQVSPAIPCRKHQYLTLLAKPPQVSPSFPIPLNAVIVSFLCGIVISLINLGSAVALNAIISLTISALLASYILSIGCILSKRLRREPLPSARWSLGRAGMAVNIIALVFLVAFFVFCFFPTATPVQPDTMNWNIVMFGGIFVWATVFYVAKGRKVYIPPVRIVKRDV